MFYNGTKLLNMKDLNGDIPEIFIVDSNRSAGKTTYFNKKLVDDFLNDGKKFMLLYRYKYEMDNCAEKFFSDINRIFYPDLEMEDKPKAQGIYHELYLDEIPCGYAVSLNCADSIKRNSHLFSDTEQMLFDEFQPETGRYCSNELFKFMSIHASVARGAGEQVRYLPIYMLANCISIINPYYSMLGISTRLKKDTKFLRGNGFVMEHHFNESASVLNESSQFNKAFSSSGYMGMLTSKSYVLDDKSFIGSVDENLVYMCTIKIKDHYISVNRTYASDMLYVTDVYDESFPVKFSVDVEGHTENFRLVMSSSPLIKQFRKYFDAGMVRFKNMNCKSDFITAICY